MPLKPTPKPTSKSTPTKKPQISPAEKAMNDLMKKRATQAKKTGSWPNYGTN
jgi:hypothetical protein